MVSKRRQSPGLDVRNGWSSIQYLASSILSLVHHQFRLEGAGALHGLEDRHHVAGGDAQGVERGGDPLDGRVVLDDPEGAAALGDVGLRRVGDRRLPAVRAATVVGAARVGLADV